MGHTRLKKVLLVGALLSTVLGLAACGSTSKKGSSTSGNLTAKSNTESNVAKAITLLDEAKSGKSINFTGTSGKTIGVLIPWTDNEGFQAEYVGVASEAIKGKDSMITTSAQEKAETGVAAVEDFITKKVNVIVLDPFEAAAFTPVIKKANEAGIPVVAYDQVPAGGELAGIYASDNETVGEGAAELTAQAAKKLGKSPGQMQVIELLGAQSSESGVERRKGYNNGAKRLGIKIVTELPTEWEEAKANSAVLDGLQAHPTANTIYMASGCALWEGVQSALKSLGRLGKKPGESGYITVISVDGCTGDMNGVRHGEVFGDSTQQLFLIGQKAGKRAVELTEGKNLSSHQKELLPPKLVTIANVNDKDNWANVIAGG